MIIRGKKGEKRGERENARIKGNRLFACLFLHVSYIDIFDCNSGLNRGYFCATKNIGYRDSICYR